MLIEISVKRYISVKEEILLNKSDNRRIIMIG